MRAIFGTIGSAADTAAFLDQIPGSEAWRSPDAAIEARWRCTGADGGDVADDGDTVAFVAGTMFDAAAGKSYAEHAAAIYREGGVRGLTGLHGSFAVAILDKRDGRLHLHTDDFGSYALFYARENGVWRWGTRMRDVAASLQARSLDVAAIPEAVCFRIFASSNTLLREVRQVPPGSTVSLGPGSEAAGMPAEGFAKYFHPARPAAPNRVDQLDAILSECLAEVRQRHFRVTVFLSGGLDSSLLLAKVMEAGFPEVRCCTAMFPGWTNPELPLARRVAAHLGVDLVELAVSDDDVRDTYAPAVLAMEEPPRHYKIFALWKMYEYASREAPLVISGIGAENVFGPKAVDWLRAALRRLARLRVIPSGIRRSAAHGLPRRRSGRVALLRNLLCCDSEQDLFSLLLLCDDRLPQPALAGGIPPVPRFPAALWDDLVEGLRTMEDRQQVFALLTEDKSDMQARSRIGSEWGVATVHPFLDPAALELGLGQPVRERMRDGWSKPLLRELATRYFPAEWIYTGKFGFPTPLARWAEGPLREPLAILKLGQPAVPGLWREDELRRAEREGNREAMWSAATTEYLLRHYLR